jgi:excisionase family DNA binding protein
MRTDALQPDKIMDPLAVSVNEACRLLGGVGRTKFYQLISQGYVKPIKVGRRTLVPVDCIRKLLHARRMADPISVMHEAEAEATCQGGLRQDGEATW